MDTNNNITIESTEYNNIIRSILENNNVNETTYNISSCEKLIIHIETLKNGIQHGNIVDMKEYDIVNTIHSVIVCKDTSIEYENIYSDFMSFLEIHDTQNVDKFNDLLDHILENMTNEEKESFPIDSDGNTLLISKPRLERTYNDNYITTVIKNDNMYKLTMSIIKNMKNILQYENDYRVNISSASSLSRGID
jgi:hypothetical protein